MKERIVFSPNLCDTKLCGETARRAEVFFENRFFSDFAKNEVFTEAEEVFKNQVDDEQPKFGIWQGEFWGKQILSAISAATNFLVFFAIISFSLQIYGSRNAGSRAAIAVCLRPHGFASCPFGQFALFSYFIVY